MLNWTAFKHVQALVWIGPNSSHDETQWKKGHSSENMHPGKFQRTGTIYFTTYMRTFPWHFKDYGESTDMWSVSQQLIPVAFFKKYVSN